MPILNYIRENFPECERVTAYARAEDALRKTDEELKQLYEAGLTMAYVGAESGSEKVLEDIHKGETRQQLIDGVKKIEASGMKASVTFISGLAGKAGAILRIDGTVLIDRETFNRYLEQFREQSTILSGKEYAR